MATGLLAVRSSIDTGGPPTPMTVGGTELVLYPTPSGETRDALMALTQLHGEVLDGIRDGRAYRRCRACE